MNLVPDRPLEIKSSYRWFAPMGGFVLILLGVLLAGGMGYWQAAEVSDLLDIQDRFERGTPTPADVSGEVTTSNFILDEYKLEIVFIDGSGEQRKVDYEFVTLFGGPGTDADASVRLDPEDSTKPILSWAAEYAGARWRAVGMFVLGSVLGAIGCGYGGWTVLQRWLATCRAAQASIEVHCPISKQTLREVNQRRFLDIECQIPSSAELPAEVRGRSFKFTYSLKKQQPLYADVEGTSLVVLVPHSMPTAAVAGHADLHPFRLSPTQAQELEDAIVERDASG